MSCSEVNWTAIGAVLTGVGGIAAAITAGIALYVGLEPRRMQQKRANLLAGVAASVLMQEVRVLRLLGARVASPEYDARELIEEGVKARTLSLLQCPLLKECVGKAHEYPDELAYEMGDLYGTASILQSPLCGLQGLCLGKPLSRCCPASHGL